MTNRLAYRVLKAATLFVAIYFATVCCLTVKLHSWTEAATLGLITSPVKWATAFGVQQAFDLIERMVDAHE